jgi:hypothetical protein
VSHTHDIELVFAASSRLFFTVHGSLSLRTGQDLNYLDLVLRQQSASLFPVVRADELIMDTANVVPPGQARSAVRRVPMRHVR